MVFLTPNLRVSLQTCASSEFSLQAAALKPTTMVPPVHRLSPASMGAPTLRVSLQTLREFGVQPLGCCSKTHDDGSTGASALSPLSMSAPTLRVSLQTLREFGVQPSGCYAKTHDDGSTSASALSPLSMSAS